MTYDNHYMHCGNQWTLTGCDSTHNDECETCHGEIQPFASVDYSKSETSLIVHDADLSSIAVGEAIVSLHESEEVERDILFAMLAVAAKHLKGNAEAQKEIAQTVIATLESKEIDTRGEEYNDLSVLKFVAGFEPVSTSNDSNVLVNVSQRISAIVDEEIVYSICPVVWKELLEENDGDEQAAFSTTEFQNNRQRVSLDQEVEDQTCVHELTLSVDAPLSGVGA